MGFRRAKNHFGHGFTIVELLVVIAVIGILAAISIVSYGAWRTTTISNQVKSDLTNAASAMENYRTFNNGYPALTGTIVSGCNTPPPTSPATSIQSVITTLTPSKNDCLTISSDSTTTSYCVDGYSTDNPSATFYISSATASQGPLSGTCATRTIAVAPGVPGSVTVTSVNGTNLSLSWTAGSNATSYNVQCASDPTYILGSQSTTVTAPTVTATITGLTTSSTYYCRVDAVNAAGTSAWVSVNTGTTNTSNSYGSLAVGTSVEGYWTTPPQGFLLENGAAVSRTTYSDLFALIGTTYGAGDGSTTFNLPDSRGRVVVNKNPSDVEFATIGEEYGSKTDIQTIAELPAYIYIQNSQTYTLPISLSGSQAAGYGLTGSGSFENRVYVGGCCTSLSTSTATNQPTGGSVAHNIIQPSIVVMRAIKYAPIDNTAPTLPAATSISGYWSSAPSGYLPEDGSAVSRTTYSSLFAVIGTTYGAGDGSTTFNLPDSRGRVAVNLSPTDAEFNTMGEKYGEKTHTMTIAEMPSHTYIQNPNAHSIYMYTSGSEAAGYGTAGYAGFQNRVIVTGGAFATSTDTATNQSIGSNAPENVIQPSIVQMSAIKYTAATGSGNAVATGTSVPTYASSAPSGYLPEDGSAVSRTTYSSLFAVIGTTYGAGDGSTTFNLPDSRGRVAVNLSPTDAEFNTMGEKYGEKTHTMTIAEMASNAPLQNPDTPSAAVYPSGSEAAGYGLVHGAAGFQNGILVTGGGTSTSTVTATNQSAGGGQAFNVIQPSIVKLFIIKY